MSQSANDRTFDSLLTELELVRIAEGLEAYSGGAIKVTVHRVIRRR